MTMNEVVNQMQAIEVDALPAIKSYPRQRSLPCYGRGKRLADIQVPKMPMCMRVRVDKTNNENISDFKTPGKCRAGRGRGKRRPAVNENKAQFRSEELAKSLAACQAASRPEGGNERVKVEDCYNEPFQFESVDKDEPVPSSSGHFATISSESREKNSATSLPSNNVTSSSSPVSDSHPLKDLTGWSVMPPCVCQLEGIPDTMDVNIIYELFSSYGTIVDWEEKRNDSSISVRMKMSDPTTCDMIEANIDKSDFSGTGSVVRCIHLKS